MKPIDEIFKNSETEKSLEVRPELWRRLERRLEVEDGESEVKTRPLWRPWMVAASLVILVGASMLWKTSNQYSVEDLSADAAPEFSKEELVFDVNWDLIPADYNG